MVGGDYLRLLDPGRGGPWWWRTAGAATMCQPLAAECGERCVVYECGNIIFVFKILLSPRAVVTKKKIYIRM